MKHLSFCALTYNCRNAQNLFLKRWEAPLVVSPACNAACLGCLSKQSKSGFEASHTRISFVPTPQEVAQVAIGHLKNGRQAMVSFGQGCEGEPLLEFSVVKESIRLIRQATKAGTIHLNTNGFSPKRLRECAAVGLDSVRISLNSFKNEVYRAYYRPKGYGLSDVLASIRAAHQSGLFVSLNLLTFPGGIDREDEVARLLRFLKKGYVDLLQLRNLSIDQDFFLKKMPASSAKPLGVYNMISVIKKECPGVRLGYFNRSREYF